MFSDLPRNVMVSKPQLTVVEYRRAESDLYGGINCTADSNPPSTYIWTRHGSLIGSGSSLFFNRSMKREDAGEYFCTAMNDIGRTNISLVVSVQCGSTHCVVFLTAIILIITHAIYASKFHCRRSISSFSIGRNLLNRESKPAEAQIVTKISLRIIAASAAMRRQHGLSTGVYYSRPALDFQTMN